jgi:hypothetical protein
LPLSNKRFEFARYDQRLKLGGNKKKKKKNLQIRSLERQIDKPTKKKIKKKD